MHQVHDADDAHAVEPTHRRCKLDGLSDVLCPLHALECQHSSDRKKDVGSCDDGVLHTLILLMALSGTVCPQLQDCCCGVVFVAAVLSPLVCLYPVD